MLGFTGSKKFAIYIYGYVSDMIKRFAGVNSRLENVLKKQQGAQQKETKQMPEEKNDMTKIKSFENPKTQEPKILKGLRGLPPAILEKILAKEKAKNIQDVTQNTEKRKEIEMMQELLVVSCVFLGCSLSNYITFKYPIILPTQCIYNKFILQVSPFIVNCHRSIKNGAAVEIDILTKFTADSYGHGKTKEEMSKLLAMFLRLVPECMEIKKYDRIEYVKKKKDSPDINVIRANLQKLVDDQKQA